MLKLYRRLISLRGSHPVLVNGSLNRIATDGDLLRYERANEAARYLTLLNLGSTPIQTFTEPGRILLSTDLAQDGREVNGRVELSDAQACIIELY
jgi:alpha-glucosidase